MTNDDIREVLVDTLDILRGGGWTQGNSGSRDDRNKPHCITGAMNIALENYGYRSEVFPICCGPIVWTIKTEYGNGPGISAWSATEKCQFFNDRPEMTFEEIERILEKTIVNLQ